MMDNKYFVFWKRIFAFWTDSLILAILANFILIFGFDFIAKIGNFGALIGFVIFMAYYGVQNSEICKGQTIGKRLFRIKVVDGNNNYLSLQKSFLRALMLTPVFVFNSLMFPIGTGAVVYQAIVGFYSALVIFLFLFNWPQRRSLHDFTVKSIVVANDCENTEITHSKKPHIIIGTVSVLFLMLCAGIFTAAPKIGLDFNQINSISKVFSEQNMKLVGYSIQRNYTFAPKDAQTIQADAPVSSINLVVADSKIDINNKNFANARVNDAARIFFKSKVSETNVDFVNISLIKRASIGANSKIQRFSKNGTQQQWREEIFR